MSDSIRAPFQDITNGQSKDPREVKRQRERERYARNRDEILKRRRQLRELKKQSPTPVNDENTLYDTHASGGSVVTHMQHGATEEAADAQHYANQNSHGSISVLDNDDESDWLHRCDTYQMQVKPGGLIANLVEQGDSLAKGSPTQLTGLDDIVGNNNDSIELMGASSSQSGPAAELTIKRQYLQRQRISRQQKTVATSIGVHVSTTSAASLTSSPCTPVINMTSTTNLGTGEVGSAHFGMSRDPQTPCIKSATKQLSTFANLYVPESFLTKNASSENRRQHARDKYSLMTDDQREVYLKRKREYSKCRRETSTSFTHDNIVAATGGSTTKTRTSSANQAKSSSEENRLGDTHIDEEFDPTGIFEPSEQSAALEDNLEPIQNEQAVHDDDDEECRIFSGLGDDKLMAEMSQKALNAARPNASADIIRHICSLIGPTKS